MPQVQLSKARTISILPSNLALLFIGMADLVTTTYLLHTGRILEANPIMSVVFNISPLLFVAVKVLTLGAYVAVMEWYKHRNPDVTRIICSGTLVAYLVIFALIFFCVNYRILLG